MIRKRKPHSLETKQKIAKSNSGKIFTPERCLAISNAKFIHPTDELLEKLNYYWSIQYLNPKIIRELCGIKTRSVYERLKTQYCKYDQCLFMPSDLYPDELNKIIELAKQEVPSKLIAQQVDRGEKQVYSMLNKMGIKPTSMRKIQAKSWISKLEQNICDELRKLGLEIEQQFYVHPFFFDIKIINYPILIEVHGDYWHCNPKVYINGPINNSQKNMMKRDFVKRDRAKLMGYKRLVIWEYDFKHDKTNVIQGVYNKVKDYQNATDNDE